MPAIGASSTGMQPHVSRQSIFESTAEAGGGVGICILQRFKSGKRFAFRFLMVLKIKFRRKFNRTAEFCGRGNYVQT